MTPDERKRLVENIVASLKKAQRDIQGRIVPYFYKADKAYGEGVEKGLGLA